MCMLLCCIRHSAGGAARAVTFMEDLPYHGAKPWQCQGDTPGLPGEVRMWETVVAPGVISQGGTLWIGHLNCSLAPMAAPQKDRPGTARPCYSPISRGTASCGTIPTPAPVWSSALGRTAPTV